MEARENLLKSVPRSIAQLKRLQRLDLGNNEIEELVGGPCMASVWQCVLALVWVLVVIVKIAGCGVWEGARYYTLATLLLLYSSLALAILHVLHVAMTTLGCSLVLD